MWRWKHKTIIISTWRMGFAKPWPSITRALTLSTRSRLPGLRAWPVTRLAETGFVIFVVDCHHRQLWSVHIFDIILNLVKTCRGHSRGWKTGASPLRDRLLADLSFYLCGVDIVEDVEDDNDVDEDEDDDEYQAGAHYLLWSHWEWMLVEGLEK